MKKNEKGSVKKTDLVAKVGPLKGLNVAVSLWSKVLVLSLIIYAFAWSEHAESSFGAINGWILKGMKWYYIGLVAVLLFYVVWLMLSRFGSIRLGKDTDRPEFSSFSWFAMLFGAGMGIGLVFWSIAEPIYHLQSNPFITPEMAGTPEAAQVAMRLTFFHWGLHPWAIYVFVGLTLAYFSYRKGLPLTIRSSLYPIIGNRIYGPIGHAADIMAILGTVFGIATSLGLGVQQIATGLHHLTGIGFFVMENAEGNLVPSNVAMVTLIALISGIATISVVSGVGKGIRILSEFNLWLSITILAFFIAFGPTRYLLNSFLQNLGDYIGHVVPLSFWSDANKDGDWQGWWTAFYWGWWISWAPFVGMFIARISKGRTIREFVAGVLLVPTLLGFIWLTLFGGTAMHIQLFGGGGIIEAVNQDVTLALYSTFNAMDVSAFLAKLAATLATLLIATYFITSSDSGTLVVNTLMSMGDPNPPVVHRVIWGVGEGAVAAVLLLTGGLKTLQTAAIAAALPFAIIIAFMILGLTKSLHQEKTT